MKPFLLSFFFSNSSFFFFFSFFRSTTFSHLFSKTSLSTNSSPQALPLAPHQAPQPGSEEVQLRRRRRRRGRQQLPVCGREPRRRRPGGGGDRDRDHRPRGAEAALSPLPSAAGLQAHRRPAADQEAPAHGNLRVGGGAVSGSRRCCCRFFSGQGQGERSDSDPPSPFLRLDLDPEAPQRPRRLRRHAVQERVGAGRGRRAGA